MKTTLKKQVNKVYSEKGLNGVHCFLKNNGIKYVQTVEEFGLHTSKTSNATKKDWLSESTPYNVFRFHYYSLGIKSKKTGYEYNRIRGTEITIAR